MMAWTKFLDPCSCFLAMVCLWAVIMPGCAAPDPLLRGAEEIGAEAALPSVGPEGRPLPLAAHWNVGGGVGDGFDSAYQLSLLRNGRHILPWFGWPPADSWLEKTWKPDDPRRQQYIDARLAAYEAPIREMARLKLPISFLSTQWESELTYDKTILDLPPEKNPNVASVDGKVLPKVSPFGPVEPWRECGRRWTDSMVMKKLQEWYPDPPLVLLISNNEHAKLYWTEVEQSKRYMDKHGAGRSDDFKRKVMADGWAERYRALEDGLREGLVSEQWRKNVRCVGYEAFGPVHFGRWPGWKEYSAYTPGQIDPQHLYWDGGSPSYYLHNWMAITDYTVWSPQIESMNWVFMQKEVYKAKPDYWFEISTWDGDQPDAGNDKRKFFAAKRELYTPQRYEGLIQFGMWLLRPRAVREFRGWLETVEYAGPYFEPILNAVDRVYASPVLERFWREGQLVPNRAHAHPYQSDVPAEYKDVERWFLLDTSLTPQELGLPREFDNANPPRLQTEVPVFALALVLGPEGKREWLVYAHAPRGARTGVTISLPEFGDLMVDVPQSGSFYQVMERGRKVTPVIMGGPADVTVEASDCFVPVDGPVSLQVTNAYSPTGKLAGFKWDFGDGATADGEKVTHRFARRGQYIVTVTAAGATVEKQTPLYVGYKPEDGLVCRMLMDGALKQHLKSWAWRGGWDKLDYALVPDASGRGNTGFLVGGKWAQDEARGAVLELGGKGERMTFCNTPDINTAMKCPDRTVSLWFKPTVVEGRQVLYEEGGSGSGVNVYLDGGTIYAGVWDRRVWPGTWLKHEGIQPGKWRHVAVVLREAKEKPEPDHVLMFVDGTQVASGDAAIIGPHHSDICVGWAGSTLYHDGKTAERTDAFAGRIDDVMVFTRALTAPDIKDLAGTE